MEQLIRLQEKCQLESSEHTAVFENVRGNLQCSEFLYVAIPMVYVSVSVSFFFSSSFFFFFLAENRRAEYHGEETRKKAQVICL